ncbi:MAG: proline--tRNA ligase, partial [Lachnospiraceae bacterium]|nr:proline--tRNA ligase [Lachnospiraceae bacterium]
PEVAWVTQGGMETLQERLCVRPTSETLFCDLYHNIVHSYRDLPKLYNQWCSVVRWEKTTRPVLRSSEFLWQEGHTAHASEEEAEEFTIRILDLYADFCRDVLAIPMIKGKKTDKEKFAGAASTYTIEALMHDGKALQSGTSHNFGDGFARAYDIQYTDKENKLQYVHQTSWGVSTRLIGALIMVHGDNSGLVLPPMVAPVQVIVIPIRQEAPGVSDAAERIANTLRTAGIRCKVDLSDKRPGWKYSEAEMRGIPLRVEIGPKDLESGQCVFVRRDSREKTVCNLEDLGGVAGRLMSDMQRDMLEKATKHLNAHISDAHNYDEFIDAVANKPGFIRAMWCGDEECENKIKEDTTATSRCMPFEQESISDVCVCCGRPAKKLVYWGKAY